MTPREQLPIPIPKKFDDVREKEKIDKEKEFGPIQSKQKAKENKAELEKRIEQIRKSLEDL